MANLDTVLQQLREEHNQAQSQVEKLNEAISVIEGLAGRSTGAGANGTRPKRTMSAAARRRIAQAQTARWAKVRKQSQPVSAVKSTRAPAKRRLSPEGRRRIAAATKARWARVKAQRTKKAA